MILIPMCCELKTGFFVVDWAEHSRDKLNLLLNYMPDKSSSSLPSSLPMHLERVPEDVSQDRRYFGLRDRTLIAVGHSFGGCTAYVHATVRISKLVSVY